MLGRVEKELHQITPQCNQEEGGAWTGINIRIRNSMKWEVASKQLVMANFSFKVDSSRAREFRIFFWSKGVSITRSFSDATCKSINGNWVDPKKCGDPLPQRADCLVLMSLESCWMGALEEIQWILWFCTQTTSCVMSLIFPLFENCGSWQNMITAFGDKNIPGDVVLQLQETITNGSFLLSIHDIAAAGSGMNLWGPSTSTSGLY